MTTAFGRFRRCMDSLCPQSPRNFQAVPVHDERIRQDSRDCTIGLEFSGFQDEDSMAQIEDEVQIVSGDNQCAFEFVKDGQQLATRARIQIAGRFIEDQN